MINVSNGQQKPVTVASLKTRSCAEVEINEKAREGDHSYRIIQSIANWLDLEWDPSKAIIR